MTEDAVLGAFWDKVGEGADRVELLRSMAGVIVEEPSREARADVRRDLVQASWRVDRRRCWVCQSHEYRVYLHHIVTVAHGGSSRPSNIVPLCHEHHRAVHPWLPEPSQHERRGGMVSMAGASISPCVATNPTIQQRKAAQQQRFAQEPEKVGR